MMESSEKNSATKNQRDEGVSESSRPHTGRNVVLAMFAFAGFLVVSMFVYWHYHTALFRPLQEALVREFPGSKPRVDGGKRKLHVESLPRILRVVMKVDIDPQKSPQEAARRVEKIRELAEQYIEVDTYDELEVHFYNPQPEKEIKQWQFTLPIRSPVTRDASPDRSAAGK
ncbi:MAG: hypothetical protein ACKVT0_01970, partial [Planctomycetaceae bacterium]